MNVFLTGVSGQDGSYAAELLLSGGHKVYALLRQCTRHDPFVAELLEREGLTIVLGDLADSQSIEEAFRSMPTPDWIINYGALSPVWRSWNEPEVYLNINAGGVARLLEGMRRHASNARFFQAGSSEQFGAVEGFMQDERTAFNPQSPYGVSKVAAHEFVKCYRASYNLFAVVGMSFNHCSPRRGPGFVTQKIATAAARVKLGLQEKIYLGNIQAQRDWGYAVEYVDACFKMLKADTPRDYVICTGETHSVREFAVESFSCLDLDFADHYEKDSRFERPADVNWLRGDPSRIKSDLGWEAQTRFKGLVGLMVRAAMERERKNA